jgi:HEAT repeat protein
MISKHWEGEGVLQALRALGPGAAPAMLARGKGEFWFEIKFNFRRMGPAALPALLEGLRNPDPEMREMSADLIGDLGPNGASAIPALAQSLGDRSAKVRCKAADGIANIGPVALAARPALLELLADKEDSVRAHARWALASIDLATGVPLLVEQLRDSNWQCAAICWLVESGPIGVKALHEQFHNLEHDSRHQALKKVRESSVNALPLLLEGLDDQAGSIRLVAASGLANSDLNLAPVLPRLLRALAQEEPTTASYVLQAIARIWPLPPKALATLAGALRHRHEEVAEIAATALRGLGAAAEPVLPQILDALRDHRRLVRRRAVSVLGCVAPEEPEVVRAICGALRDEDDDLRSQAAHLLGAIRADAGQVDGKMQPLSGVSSDVRTNLVIEALRARLRDSNDCVRLEATAALFRLGAGDDEMLKSAAWKVLETCGKSTVPLNAAQLRAISLLEELGPRAAQAVPVLTLALWDRNVFIPSMAAEALRSIGPAARGAIPSLRRLLHSDHSDDGAAALAALAAIGEEGAAAIHEELARNPGLIQLVDASAFKPTPGAAVFILYLIERLQSGSEEERTRALVALERLKLRSRSVCDGLVRSLTDENEMIRMIACRVLGSMGAVARPAIPALCEMMLERNADLRAQAIASLQEIGPDTRIALPALVESLTDPDEGVRCRAAEALGSMGEAARPASAALCAALRDPEDRVRLAAAMALGRVEESKERAVQELAILMESGKKSVRVEAAAALSQLDPKHPVVPALVRMLEHAPTRLEVVEILLNLPRQADEVAAFVRPLLRHKEYGVRRAAQRILWTIPRR